MDASIGGEFGRIMGWADKYRKLQVRTNADTPARCETGAEASALRVSACAVPSTCSLTADRIAAIREMICSDTVEQREKLLWQNCLPMQQGDFEELYEAMEGCPVTIRFLDPPLHEFVPTDEEDIEAAGQRHRARPWKTSRRSSLALHEFNPMMGHRGCRLAVTYPEIAEMQTKAVIQAALNVQKKASGLEYRSGNHDPAGRRSQRAGLCQESCLLRPLTQIIKAAAGSDMHYKVGTMIEIPRAALTADEIAKEAEFFSFGTNDLTQMTFGFSRDDAGKFLGAYYDKKIYENDPFAKLDQTGVGKLVKMAADLGKADPS